MGECKVQTEGIVPLNFGAALAAQIPQVQMPADWNMGSEVGMVGLGINISAAIPWVQLPVGL